MNDREFEIEKPEGQNWGFNILVKYTNRRRFSVSDPRSIGSNVELVRFSWRIIRFLWPLVWCNWNFHHWFYIWLKFLCDLEETGPAASAGIVEGSKLIALDGILIDESNFETCISKLNSITPRKISVSVSHQSYCFSNHPLPPPRHSKFSPKA